MFFHLILSFPVFFPAINKLPLLSIKSSATWNNNPISAPIFSNLLISSLDFFLIIKKKSKNDIKKFENIGADIGLLFQVADDLIDYKGSLLVAGKKTGKDKKKGKATLISLLGYKNTIKYANNLILKINNKLKKYGSRSRNLSETLNYI